MSRKFDKVFSEALISEEGDVIACSRRQYTKEQALELFRGYDANMPMTVVREDTVRYQGGYNMYGDWCNAWYFGEGVEGIGSAQPIWVAER